MEQKVMNRWIIVVGAILIQLSLGAIYAWSVFTPPLVAPLPDDDFINDLGTDVIIEVEGELDVGSEETITLSFSENGAPYTQYTNVSVLIEMKDNDGNIVKSEKIIPYIGYVYDEGEPITVGPYEGVMDGNTSTFDAKVTKSGSWHMVITATDGNTTDTFEVMQNVRTGEFGFTKTQSQMIFAAGLFTFALFTIFGGRLSKKFGPRKMAIAGGIVLGSGYILASFVGGNFALMLLCIGVLGGAGIGLAYVVPIAVGVKWFPDKKGMISGLAVAGFGFGALLWMKLCTGFTFGPIKITGNWGGLYEYFDVTQVFLIYGIAFAAAVIGGGLLMQNPPDGWLPKGWEPPEAKSDSATGSVEFTSSQMRKTPQYWMLFFMFMVGAGSGLMVIGVIKLFGIDALQDSGSTAAEASVIAGTAMALFYSLANGIGRIVWGLVSDKIGRKMSFVLMFSLQGLMMLAFFFIGGNEYLLYAGAAIIGFNFGGNFALFPAATADFFGNKSVGLNYGWVFLSYGFGGIIGPIAGGIMGDNEAW
ncbi:MAG: OFA family MFS transporter, partial [Candidatus Thermoplasmatota archaeon]|nr:OFA family MFS transporter [Candidatus Thermoplasmatota archaeon]